MPSLGQTNALKNEYDRFSHNVSRPCTKTTIDRVYKCSKATRFLEFYVAGFLINNLQAIRWLGRSKCVKVF